MKPNEQEIKQTEVTQTTQRTGFNTSIMPVLSKNGEHIYFFLPGDITVCEYSNRFTAVRLSLAAQSGSTRNIS